MESPSEQQMSDRLITLLTSYTLCKEALEHQRVLQDHVTESMFQSGVIAYYSVFKDRNEKRWLREILKKESIPKGLKLRLRYALPLSGPDATLSHGLWSIFEQFEKIRDKNIAHKDSDREPEQKIAWLRVPEGVAGSETEDQKGITYIAHRTLEVPVTEKWDFLNLVGATIDIVWQREEMDIYRLNADGNLTTVATDVLEWPEY